MLRTALLVLMLLGLDPALAAVPGAPIKPSASFVADEGVASTLTERIAQYRSDRGRGGVYHHRSFGRGDDWRGHHRGYRDKPHWREHDFRGDGWQHKRRRHHAEDRRYGRDRSRYDGRHDRRDRWDDGRFHDDDWRRRPGDDQFRKRRERFDARRDRW